MTGEKRVGSEELLTVCEDLRQIYDFLVFITAVDYPERDVLEMVYYLRSMARQDNLVLKTEVPRRNSHINSVCAIWPAAEWHEREVFDLFGVKFIGHPDPRRILLPEDWEGHPLLKDYSNPRVISRPETIK